MESGDSELGDVTTGTPGYAATIVGQLADAGYDCEWGVVSASEVGAPHQRERWWCIGVADSDSQRGCSRATHWQYASDVGQSPESQERDGCYPVWPPGPDDTEGWVAVLNERPDLAPAITKDALAYFRGVDDGRSHRVDELKALGNGLLPSVVAEFLRRIGL